MPQRPQKVNFITNYAQGVGPINPLSGTSLNLLNAWKGFYNRTTSGSAVTLNILTNAIESIPIGAVFTFCQAGAGAITVTPAVGVTVNSAGALLASAAQYAVFSLIKVGENEWDLCGNLA